MSSTNRLVKILSNWVKGIFYALKLLLFPKDILTLLKLGNLLTETKSFELFLNRVEEDDGAQRLISQRYSKWGFSIDDLDQLPQGSLGKVFATHLQSNNLQLYPYRIDPNSTKAVYLRERQREIHDILHAVFDLGIEIKDEAKLNSILVIQSCPPISVLIVAGSLLNAVFKNPSSLGDLVKSISEGFALGKETKNLFSIPWEDFMSTQVSELKTILAHGKPTATLRQVQ